MTAHFSGRLATWALAALLGAALTLRQGPARACGPCTEPGLRDVQRVGDDLFVVTNFGLLRTAQNGWHLECEELFAGVVTKSSLTEQALLVSSATGFYTGNGDICTWQESSEGASNRWFLDFAAVFPAGDAGADPVVVALVNDRDSSEGKIEVAALGDPFHTVAVFPPTAGLRKVVAGGDRPWVYTTGYTYGPRVWHVYDAPLGAETFSERTVEAEDEPSEFAPLAVDPLEARLWIRQAMTNDEPDALWAWDRGEDAPRRVLRLARGEKLADLALGPSGAYVAARGAERSSVYKAEPGQTRFDKLASFDLQLACLEVTDDGWLACNADFTRDSPWVIASSVDQGETWAPELTTLDLGQLTSCGEVCATTSAWLYGVFGAVTPTPSGGGVRDFDGGLPAPLDASVANDDPESEVSERPSGGKGGGGSSGGCRISHEPSLLGLWAAALLALLTAARQRRSLL